MDCKKAMQLVESLYGFTVLDVRQLDGYDDRNFYVGVSLENHSNPHVERICQHGYVLKVTNSIDSQKPHVGAYSAIYISYTQIKAERLSHEGIPIEFCRHF